MEEVDQRRTFVGGGSQNEQKQGDNELADLS